MIDTTGDHLDLDNLENRKKFDQIAQKVRNESQLKFLDLCRSSFQPGQIFAENSSKPSSTSMRKLSSKYGSAIAVDIVWFFEMNGRQFDWIKKPHEVGVFDTTKCYYVVFYKEQ